MNWIVTEVFYPDEVSTALIMTEIAEAMADGGNVGVICGPSGYEKNYSHQKKVLADNIIVKRVDSGSYDKNKLTSRIVGLTLLTVKMFFSILKNVKKGDTILIVTNPAFMLIAVGIIKKIKGIRLNVLVHDVFPNNLVPAGLINRNSFRYAMLDKIFNFSYKTADNLIVLGDDMKELMAAKLMSQDYNKLKVIPNWYDPAITPIDGFSASDYYNLPLDNKIVISFAGNLGRLQGIPDFLDIFIKANNQYLALVLLGEGAMKDVIKKKLEAESVSNVYLVGSKPRAEQINFLNACDIGLITLKSGMKGLGVPSKAYNVMAAQKPILYIGDIDSENDRYVKRYDIGWSFEWNNPDEIISFLKKISLNDRDLIKKKGLNALAAARRHFERNFVLEKFKQV